MIPKSGYRFSEKIMPKQATSAGFDSTQLNQTLRRGATLSGIDQRYCAIELRMPVCSIVGSGAAVTGVMGAATGALGAAGAFAMLPVCAG